MALRKASAWFSCIQLVPEILQNNKTWFLKYIGSRSISFLVSIFADDFESKKL